MSIIGLTIKFFVTFSPNVLLSLEDNLPIYFYHIRFKKRYYYNNNHVPYILHLTHLLEVHYLKDHQDHNIYFLEVLIPFLVNRGCIELWISNFPPLFYFTNCVLIIPHDPHFAFNINLLFLDLTYVGSMCSVFFFFFYAVNYTHYFKYPIYVFMLVF